MRPLNIVHLMHDEKFIDGFIHLMGDIPNCRNIYFLFSSQNELRYVKSPAVILVRRPEDIIKKLAEFESIDGILIHFFDEWKARALILLKKKYPYSKVIWFAWGGDFYGKLNYSVYQEESVKLLKNKRFMSNYLRLYFKKVSLNFWKNRWKEVSLIDYCSTIVPNEYNLISSLKGFRAKQLHLTYFDSHSYSIVQKYLNNINLKNSVLIGNSANITNNHLDIFRQIYSQKHKIEGKIIVPLSYAGVSWYKDAVIDRGNLLFGEHFYPLTSFLSIDDYYRLISSCGVAIFNHDRQQALGNSNVILYLGLRLYLSENSPVYRYYKDIGLHVFSLQSDFEKFGFERLKIEQIEENRDIVGKFIWNQARASFQITEMLDLIKSAK